MLGGKEKKEKKQMPEQAGDKEQKREELRNISMFILLPSVSHALCEAAGEFEIDHSQVAWTYLLLQSLDLRKDTKWNESVKSVSSKWRG